MIYLTYEEVVELHDLLIEASGGEPGILNDGNVRSAVAQPEMSVFGQDAYPTLVDKATALGFSLIQNHGFRDGNKRIGQAAMERLLFENGFEIAASVDDQEAVILGVASGSVTREELAEWVCEHIVPIE